MRIITCLKYVPEIPVLTEKFVIRRDLAYGKINPADMFAIEESVRIKERYGAETVGLCMGVPGAVTALKHAVAMGLDKMVLMSDRQFAGSDTFATSYILSRGIAHIGKYDLVICGKQSTDGDTGQVAQELASHMDVPCLINVVSLEFIENNQVRCVVLTEQGYLEANMLLPAVISVLKGINEPRVPPISGIIKAQSADIEMIGTKDIDIDITKCGLRGSPTRVKSVRQCSHEKRETIDITDEYISMITNEVKKVREFGQVCQKVGPRIRAGDCEKAMYSKKQDEVWVVCEVSNGKISGTSLQVLSKASSIVKGSQCLCAVILEPVSNGSLEYLAKNYSIDRLYCVYKEIKTSVFDESKPNTLCVICRKYNPSIVLFGATVWGRWIAPLVAAKLRTGLTADCLDFRIEEGTGKLLQIRTAYGGNLVAEIVCPDMRPQMATVRTNIFPDTPIMSGDDTYAEVVDISENVCCNSRISVTGMKSTVSFAKGLADADIVLCGGRGIGGRQGFDKLFALSHLLGGAVGATRYAVDAGWIDYSFQIGQTGTIVRPNVYINFGVSGAVEHIVGMQNSKCIISINMDPNAPIFAYSHYKIVDRCDTVLDTLIKYFTDL